jgi:hypothetical protein
VVITASLFSIEKQLYCTNVHGKAVDAIDESGFALMLARNTALLHSGPLIDSNGYFKGGYSLRA